MPKFRTSLLLAATALFLGAATLFNDLSDLFLRLADRALGRSRVSVEEMEDR